MNLSERLLNLRKNKNLSQEEVADIIGVSRQTISKWETGISTPEFDKIEPLCKLYEISVDELVSGKKVESVKPDSTSKPNSKSTILLIVSIFIYFLAVIAVIILDENGLPDSIVASSFLFLIAIATCILVFRAITFGNNKQKQIKSQKIINKKFENIKSIISLITLIIYLVISFITFAWYITWIIWIIYALIIEIVKLIFTVKGEDIDE